MTSPTPIAIQPDAWPQAESETVEFKTSVADEDRQMSARELESLILKHNSAALRRGNVSHRRNPLVADLFRRIEMVEAWGRGMPLILQNAPDVEFREIARLFVASFERPSATVETTKETEINSPETGLEPSENTKKTPRKQPETPKKTLLAMLQQQPDTSIRALAEKSGLSQASVRHHLRRMQADNLLRRVGPDKGGYWEVITDSANNSPPEAQGKV